MRNLTVLTLILLAMLTLLRLAPNANAARGMQIAVQDDGAFTGAAASADHAAAAARGLHAGSIRVIVPWADVGGAAAYSRRPPAHRHYNFVSYEGLVYRAQLLHIQVQMVLAVPRPHGRRPTAARASSHRRPATTVSSHARLRSGSATAFSATASGTNRTT